MISMKTCNFLVALITAAIGAAIAWTSYGYGIAMSVFGLEAGFWPFVMGVALLFAAALIVVDTVAKAPSYSQIQVALANADNIKAYVMMLLCAAYVVSLLLLGFYLSSFLFMMLSMFFLGMRRIGVMLSVSLIFLGVIYLFFSVLLHISLPQPFFME